MDSYWYIIYSVVEERTMNNNIVAKHAHKYNTAKVFVDRKARAVRGYMKHNRPDESYKGRNGTQRTVGGNALWEEYQSVKLLPCGFESHYRHHFNAHVAQW
jgi:hypothetical protein